jgi:hypothetical protein
MPTCRTPLEVRLFSALKRITHYERPERLLTHYERTYGVPGREAVEMAYDNVLEEARRAVRGVRLPPAPKQRVAA